MSISGKASFVAIVATLAICNFGVSQDFSQFSTAPTTESAKAVYLSVSDQAGPNYVTQAAAYETLDDSATLPISTAASSPSQSVTMTLNDNGPSAEGSYQRISDAGSTSTQTLQSVLPKYPSTGIASELPVFDSTVGNELALTSFGASCGVPATSTCGAPAPSEISCGLPSLGCSSCDSGCDSCCDTIQCGDLCTRTCPTVCGVGTHRTFIFGEALYLRARNAEVVYAVPADGPIAGGQVIPIQVGNFGVLDPDYELGFRGGINVALDTVSSLSVRYTLFESLTENEISVGPPDVLRSLVTHPSSATAAQDAQAAQASLEIDFDTLDASYRHLWKGTDISAVNYVIGARYAKLEQQFDAEFLKLGTENVSTDIDFDGGGVRLGLEAERYSCRNKLHVYANGYASFLAGRFRGRYFQGSAFDPQVVNAEWEAGRIVPVLDLEAGVGWTSDGGKIRLSAGYLVSAWFNTASTQDLINAFQSNNYNGMSDTITFDGLQGRIEYRF